MKIDSVTAKLFHAVGQTEGWTDGQTDRQIRHGQKLLFAAMQMHLKIEEFALPLLISAPLL
jgi:hypothetical protein